MARFKQNNSNRGTLYSDSNNLENKVVSKIKKKVNGNQTIGDARNILHAKSRRQMLATDARDKLVKLAKDTDARQKLEKIRNLKQGKFDVKKTKKGGITIVTTTQGQIQLTTKKKSKNSDNSAQANQDKGKIGRNFTRDFNQTGKVSLSSNSVSSVHQYLNPNTNTVVRVRNTSAKKQPNKNLQVILKQPMSRAAKLDEELINTHVDTALMKRTIRQAARDRSRSPLRGRPIARYRSRSRSPIYSNSRNYYPEVQRSTRIHYDDPRREALEAELIRQKIRETDRQRQSEPLPLHLTSGGIDDAKPMETKVIVSNLASTVSQEDLMELFGDVGQLRRVKLSQSSGLAELVFLNGEDADKAIDIYNNRKLDGKAMKCHLATVGSPPKSDSGPRLNLPSESSRHRQSYQEERFQEPTDTTSAVHRALFGQQKAGPQRERGQKPSRRMESSRNRSTSPRTSLSFPRGPSQNLMRSSRSQRDQR